jgi:hypothetical protein
MNKSEFRIIEQVNKNRLEIKKANNEGRKKKNYEKCSKARVFDA